MRVAHIITRMIVGGAQENTLLNCIDLRYDWHDEVVLVTGPTEGPEGKLLEQGRADAINVEVIQPLQRAIHPFRDWSALKQIKSFLSKYRPDVVHTHSAKGGILGRRAAWDLNVPAIIHSVHGAPFHNYQSAMARSIYRLCEIWAAKRCHHFICVADAMTDLMVNAGVATRNRFTTVYSGMEIEPFGAHQADPVVATCCKSVKGNPDVGEGIIHHAVKRSVAAVSPDVRGMQLTTHMADHHHRHVRPFLLGVVRALGLGNQQPVNPARPGDLAEAPHVRRRLILPDLIKKQLVEHETQLRRTNPRTLIHQLSHPMTCLGMVIHPTQCRLIVQRTTATQFRHRCSHQRA